MSRYEDALAPVVRRIERERRGWGFVQCVAGEQFEVASCLGRVLGLPVAAVSDDLEPFNECVVHLVPRQPAAIRDAALSSINGRRDRLSDRGRFILVASRSELAPLQRYAADIFSVLRFAEEVPLVPRPLSAEEQLQARQQLADWYRERFGRLDLRGFVRSETEDASFAVEEIFEPLEAMELPPDEEGPSDPEPDGGSSALLAGDERAAQATSPHVWRSFHAELAQAQHVPRRLLQLLEQSSAPCLLLGAPGSGKSFFLRWCALKASAAPEDLPGFSGAGGLFPVLVPLAAVGLMPGQPPLIDYVVETLLSEGLVAGHLFAAAAMDGRALFLLDGLDETAAPRAAWTAVLELVMHYPRARILVTSRPGVRGELEPASLRRVATRVLVLSRLSPGAIRALLVRWCELYELHREGTEAARQRGRATGEELARQVADSPPVRELATSPLLVTVIAVVHRAGVRLPDRRVELYEHALKILVERWNQARSRESPGAAAILRLPDAIRLLGPVALEMLERDREGAIDAETLESLLRDSLAKGHVRGLTDAALAMQLFRTSLGLFVERAPGVYGFLHQTFVEFLAAHELVRTGKFLGLVKSSRRAFTPKWREVVLLGAGILGVLQANDEELGAAVLALVSNARKAKNTLAEVPVLLSSLVTDDPSLSTEMASALLEELIPRWWFDGGAPLSFFLGDAVKLFARLSRGPWHAIAKRRVEVSYGFGGGFFSKKHPLRGPIWAPIQALEALGIEVAGFVCSLFAGLHQHVGAFLFSADVEKLERRTSTPPGDAASLDPVSDPDPGARLVSGVIRLSPGMRILLRHTQGTRVWWLLFSGNGELHPLLFSTPPSPEGDVEVWFRLHAHAGEVQLPTSGHLNMTTPFSPHEAEVAKRHVMEAYEEIVAAQSRSTPTRRALPNSD